MIRASFFLSIFFLSGCITTLLPSEKVIVQGFSGPRSGVRVERGSLGCIKDEDSAITNEDGVANFGALKTFLGPIAVMGYLIGPVGGFGCRREISSRYAAEHRIREKNCSTSGCIEVEEVGGTVLLTDQVEQRKVKNLDQLILFMVPRIEHCNAITEFWERRYSLDGGKTILSWDAPNNSREPLNKIVESSLEEWHNLTAEILTHLITDQFVPSTGTVSTLYQRFFDYLRQSNSFELIKSDENLCLKHAKKYKIILQELLQKIKKLDSADRP